LLEDVFEQHILLALSVSVHLTGFTTTCGRGFKVLLESFGFAARL